MLIYYSGYLSNMSTSVIDFVLNLRFIQPKGVFIYEKVLFATRLRKECAVDHLDVDAEEYSCNNGDVFHIFLIFEFDKFIYI